MISLPPNVQLSERWPLTVAIYCCLLTAAALTGCGDVNTQPAAPAVDTSNLPDTIDPADFERNVWFRRGFDLKTDRDYVLQVMQNPDFRENKGKTGVVLSDEELEQVQQQAGSFKQILLIKTYVRTNIDPKDYAGLYLDTDHGRRVVVGFARPLGEMQYHIKVLRSIIPQLKIQQVEYSEQYLRDL